LVKREVSLVWDVGEGLMVCDNFKDLSIEVMSPCFEAFCDGQEFLVGDVIIALSWVEFTRFIGYWMPAIIIIFLEEDSCPGIMFCMDREVLIKDVQNWCSDQSLLELIENCLSDFGPLSRLLFFGELG
jgi:hypothetical protein